MTPQPLQSHRAGELPGATLVATVTALEPSGEWPIDERGVRRGASGGSAVRFARPVVATGCPGRPSGRRP
jgi:hypothetical protein